MFACLCSYTHSGVNFAFLLNQQNPYKANFSDFFVDFTKEDVLENEVLYPVCWRFWSALMSTYPCDLCLFNKSRCLLPPRTKLQSALLYPFQKGAYICEECRGSAGNEKAPFQLIIQQQHNRRNNRSHRVGTTWYLSRTSLLFITEVWWYPLSICEGRIQSKCLNHSHLHT